MKYTFDSLEARALSALALGDALGLPYENLSRRAVARLQQSRPAAALMFRGQMIVSDDTQHAVFTAKALHEAGEDADVFKSALGRGLARWLRTCPPGIGGATLRSCLKLNFGRSPARSGVWSAGNGPMMRVPVIALRFRGNPAKMAEFVRISTRVTHTDPKAEIAALLLTEVIVKACKAPVTMDAIRQIMASLKEQDIPEKDIEDFSAMLENLFSHDPACADPEKAFAAIGCGAGITGYIYHSVASAIWIAMRAAGDVADAIEISIAAGGDTDSVAAIAATVTAVTPGAIMPDTELPAFLGQLGDDSILEQVAKSLSPDAVGDTEFPAAPPLVRELLENLASFAVMVGHLLRRRF